LLIRLDSAARTLPAESRLPFAMNTVDSREGKYHAGGKNSAADLGKEAPGGEDEGILTVPA